MAAALKSVVSAGNVEMDGRQYTSRHESATSPNSAAGSVSLEYNRPGAKNCRLTSLSVR